MANQEQLAILKQGVDAWNEWRAQNPGVKIVLSQAYLNGTTLSGANLKRANLSGANLSRVNLSKANLTSANLSGADLQKANLCEVRLVNAKLPKANFYKTDLIGADLRKAQFYEVNFRQANLSEVVLDQSVLIGSDLCGAKLVNATLVDTNLRRANLNGTKLSGADLSRVDLSYATLDAADLTGANLSGANLFHANLRRADLRNTDLTGASLVGTQIKNAKLSGSWVYAVNVWDLHGEFEEQKDLIITRKTQSIITVDNIKVAQFIYMILNNGEIRHVINTLTSKSVLILGRFSLPERKSILDSLRNKLREYNLLPIVFDFDRPTDKDFTETIKTLAGLCYFVIADVTNPKSSPLELQATVPDYQIPFVPIIQEGENPFAMMVDLQKKYNWVLNTVTYDSVDTLVKILKPLIIDPAMKKRNELRIIKAQVPEVISGKGYLGKGRA